MEPALAGEVLGQILAGKPLPHDGAGPWIELIGTAGRPAELRQLFDQLLRGELAEGADVRAISSLANASRLRGVRPDGELATFGSLFEASRERVRIGALRLAGAWRLDRFSPQMMKVASDVKSSPVERTAAFGALRELGGAGVIKEMRQLVAAAGSPETSSRGRRHSRGLGSNGGTARGHRRLAGDDGRRRGASPVAWPSSIRGAGTALTDAVTKVQLSENKPLSLA